MLPEKCKYTYVYLLVFGEEKLNEIMLEKHLAHCLAHSNRYATEQVI